MVPIRSRYKVAGQGPVAAVPFPVTGMYRSQELRWFLPGDLPPGLPAWLETRGPVHGEPCRVDEYLILPGCDTVGVKLREGRFEVKARTDGPVDMALPHGLRGRRDGWIKWSRPLGAVGHWRDHLALDGDDWLFVAKRRRLVRVAVDDRGVRPCSDPADAPAQGCQLELSAIRVRAGRQGPAETRPADPDGPEWAAAPSWWSLSLEAFGDPADLVGVLAQGARKLLADPPPARLPYGAARSYPAWIAGHVRLAD